ncbi:MAG: GPW/gp25 family protein [Candidatus Baltobacteraceae bacterium]
MIGIAGTAPITSPYGIDGRGRTAEAIPDDHVRDMIQMVLFTAPGQRVMRPTFGSGVLALVFGPNDQSVAATTQFLIAGALQTWLGDLIVVGDVAVTSEDATLTIFVSYTIRSSGTPASAAFTLAR